MLSILTNTCITEPESINKGSISMDFQVLPWMQRVLLFKGNVSVESI